MKHTHANRTSAADRRRLSAEADRAWTIHSLVSEILTPIALAVFLYFAPFEIDSGNRLALSLMVFAVAPIGLLISAILAEPLQSTMYTVVHCSVAVAAAFLDPQLWYPSTAALIALLTIAVVLERHRNVAAVGAVSFMALAVAANQHPSSPTNWYVTLLVGAAVITGSAVWYQGWEQAREDLIKSHDEMLERARTFSWTVDRHSREVLTIAGNLQGVLGYEAQEVLGKPLPRFMRLSDEGRAWTEGDEAHAVMSATHRNGHTVTLHEVRLPSDDESVIRGVSTDITEAARATEALRHQAEHDPLTDLYNRKAIRVRAEQALEAGGRAALILIDLDRFKEVNDTLGHATGDQLLLILSQRLLTQFGDRATVARIGGDEFALLLPDVDIHTATDVAHQVSSLASTSAQIDGFTLSTSASIGIAAAPEHGETYDELLRSADIASYAAKAEGGSVRVFDTVPDQMSKRRLQLLTELSTAIDAGEFELFLQPKVRVSDGVIIGAEGLARWRHPELGVLTPADFLHALAVAADQHKFTNEMLRQAVDTLAALGSSAAELHIAVNLGAMNLRDEGLPARLEAMLEVAGVAGSSLIFELVESDLVQGDRLQTAVLDGLKQLGVRVSIDDFGTGYSNFSQLKSLAADEIKIDRSLIAGLGEDPHDSTIVESMIDLARKLNYSVVAEGVESEAQALLLRDLGCDLAQGFWYARPAPQREFLDLVAGRRHGCAATMG